MGRVRISKEDKAWSQAVKILAKGLCEYCLRPAENSHHFYSRRYKSTRYDTNNGFSLCVKHHFWAHHSPADFIVWAINKRGGLWHELLKEKSRRVKQDVSLDQLYCRQVCKKGN